MTDDSKKRKGTFGRVIDAIAALEDAMDYTPYDYVLDRVCNLEREVLLLRDELRALPVLNSAGDHAKPASSSPPVQSKESVAATSFVCSLSVPPH